MKLQPLTFTLFPCATLFSFFFFFNDTAPTEIYTFPLHASFQIFLNSCFQVIEGGSRHEDPTLFPECFTDRIRRSGRDGSHGSAGSHPYQTYESRSEEHTSELQSRPHLVCRLLLEKKIKSNTDHRP